MIDQAKRTDEPSKKWLHMQLDLYMHLRSYDEEVTSHSLARGCGLELGTRAQISLV